MTTTATRPPTGSTAGPAALPGAVLPTGYVLACGVCQIPGGTFAAQAEAELLACTHDQLHHGGHPTAQITGGGTCESCGRRRAVRAWHYPPAGAPFQLCADCRPTTGPTIGHPADDQAHDVDAADAPGGQVIDLRDHATPGRVTPCHGGQDGSATPTPVGGARW